MATLKETIAPFRAQLRTTLDDADLASLLLTFPACLVADADGNFDRAEQRFVMEVCERLGEDRATPDEADRRLTAADRYACLMQLLARRTELEGPIFKAIRTEVSRDPSTLPLVRDMLDGAAEASGKVTPSERAEIQRILSAIT